MTRPPRRPPIKKRVELEGVVIIIALAIVFGVLIVAYILQSLSI